MSSTDVMAHERSPLMNGDKLSHDDGAKNNTARSSYYWCTKDESQRKNRRRFVLIGALTALLVLVLVVNKSSHTEESSFRPLRTGGRDDDDDDHGTHDKKNKGVNVAFVGNSMFYFNDFPRFFQTLAGEDLVLHQDSCLHGGGSIPSLLMEGNAMYPQFKTEAAVLERPSEQMQRTIYDYGACTPPQLVLGTDDRLGDPGYAVPVDTTDDSWNPCREDETYLAWAEKFYAHQNTAWDYILLNDNTRDPARRSSRARSLQFLEQFWVPLLRTSGATPVFLWTHAYEPVQTIDHTHNMTGLQDMGNFTSLTYAGLKAYVRLLTPLLPAHQKPRIAPSGLAFLAVYEDDVDTWHSLFHNADHLHASPSGTFLQGLCVYHTLFGKMPPKETVVRTHMKTLWETARMMQHAWEPPNPFPTKEQAEYLYDMAVRVLVKGHVPKSFVNYTHGEVAYGQD